MNYLYADNDLSLAEKETHVFNLKGIVYVISSDHPQNFIYIYMYTYWYVQFTTIPFKPLSK